MNRSLLMIIDLQEGWRHKTATEPAMLQTIAVAKQFDGDVIHCCFRNDENSLFYTELHWSRFFEPSDTDEIKEIQPLQLPIYWRSTYSCVTSEIRELTKQYDEVYIAGVFTDVSVESTAMNLFDENVRVKVLVDCVASLHGEPAHYAALRSLESTIGGRNLVTSNSVLDAQSES